MPKVNFRYEGEYNSEYKQRISETVEYILDKDYGTTIENATLAELLHYNIETEEEYKKFKSAMGRVKNIVIDYGRVLKSITGVGYYILKPKQISGYCYHTYIKKTTKLLDKSARILNHTQHGLLSETRKEEYNDVLDLNMDVTMAIEGTIESSKYYDRKAYYDSLKDD